jgi:hydrogenase maturation protease
MRHELLLSPETVLVVGYGNTLRGDDGVGRQVADAVAAWGLAHVRALSVHQLTPELAEPLAHARLALFVDACLGGTENSLRVQILEPMASAAALGHAVDPRLLLALARALYGRCPPARLITVPGLNFDLGEGLTPFGESGRKAALHEISMLLAGGPGKEGIAATTA